VTITLFATGRWQSGAHSVRSDGPSRLLNRGFPCLLAEVEPKHGTDKGDYRIEKARQEQSKHVAVKWVNL
jgi:hypothetical protein